jgi:carboxymethylenebutenolidase
MVYHFGELDRSIPMTAVDQIKAAHPEGIYHIYRQAQHGFDCADRDTFDPAPSQLAFQRSLDFIAEHSH